MKFRIGNGNNVRKLLLIRNEPLNIKEHFSGFSDIRELKKCLRSQPFIELFDDNFARCSQRFRQLFGMNSDKAIELLTHSLFIKHTTSISIFNTLKANYLLLLLLLFTEVLTEYCSRLITKDYCP